MYVFAGTTCVRYAEAKVLCYGKHDVDLQGTTCVRYAEAKVEVAIHEPPPTGTTCVWYATKASKKTGLARLFGYIRNFVRKPTVFSIWLL